MRGIFLAIMCLILVTMPGFALEEEAKEAAKEKVGTEVEKVETEVIEKGTSKVKSRVGSKVESGVRKGLKFLPFGGEALGDLLFGSEAEKSLEVQKEILETNQNTLTQIRAMAKDALKLKRKIEEMDRLRRRAIRLGQTFKKTSYAKMGLALSENALGISCNPGHYIPNTAYTRKLKRNLDFRCGREKQFFSSTKRFLKRTVL
jgi:hypothetical protein